jgi:hypothetical protein
VPGALGASGSSLPGSAIAMMPMTPLDLAAELPRSLENAPEQDRPRATRPIPGSRVNALPAAAIVAIRAFFVARLRAKAGVESSIYAALTQQK